MMKTRNSRLFLWMNLIYIVVLVLSGCGQNKSQSTKAGGLDQFIPQEKNLNVLIISFDALRADALGVYGNKQNTSANIDAFASNSLVFDWAHTVSQSTPTSFSAMFTSKLPHRSFVGWKLVKGQTIAKVFKNDGYYTSFVTVNAQLTKKRNFDQGFDSYHLLDSSRDEDMMPEVLAKIDEIKSKKFFAWFHFLSPHAPYELRGESNSFYTPSDSYPGKYKTSVPIKYKLTKDEDIKHIKQLYLSEVYYADLNFRKILAKVKQAGLFDNTIIVVTSDHGEEFLEHGGIEHNNLFEEITHIPLIIRHPQALKSGRTDLPYANIDLLPTLAGMVDVSVADRVEGVNLFMKSSDFKRKIVAIAMTKGQKVEMSLLHIKNKIINSCTPKRKVAFFELNKDPAEMNDQNSRNANLVQGYLGDLRNSVGDKPCDAIFAANRGVSPEKDLSTRQIDKLKSLGYLK